jgi:hypothetical protein
VIQEAVRAVSLEAALNSRVSTGGWRGIERGGQVGETPLREEQVDFAFRCLRRTPRISAKPVKIACGDIPFDADPVTGDARRLDVAPAAYPRIKCPSIRVHWVAGDAVRTATFATRDENAYLVERGMGQEMLHLAGAIAQVGVNMIGGTYVDLVPMVPYLTSAPPAPYRAGNLPDPKRNGSVSAATCIDAWRPSAIRPHAPVPRSTLGQLLWAGVGCTPHKTFRYHRYGTLSSEGQGKTIPSASATYTTTLSVIDEDGLSQYVNWDDQACCATHSLGRIKKGVQLRLGAYQEGAWVYTRDGDLLRELQDRLPGLAEARTYIVVASNRRLRPYFSLMEAGYAALHVVLQAHALNLASDLFVLSREQMNEVRSTVGVMDAPLVFIPIGLPARG